jgi:hypothetical protein
MVGSLWFENPGTMRSNASLWLLQKASMVVLAIRASLKLLPVGCQRIASSDTRPGALAALIVEAINFATTF